MKSRDVDELLASMTLREKVGQLVMGKLCIDHQVDEVAEQIRAGNYGSIIVKAHEPEMINRVQKIAVEETRLGIPILMCADILHGFRTCLPVCVAAACSWNPELVEKTARMSAAEARAAGFHWGFAPMVDVARDKRWGRLVEGAGEDVLLGSRMAAAQVRGLGMDDEPNSIRLAACPKHFVGYGAAESGIDYNRVHMNMATMHDTYLPPFRAAVDVGAPTIMTAFHELNGTPLTCHKGLVNDVLREQWSFDGVIVSDANAIRELEYFGVAEDAAAAAELALRTGIDVDMYSYCYLEELEGLVERGCIPEALIDRSVRRVLALKQWCRVFEHPYADPKKHSAVLGCREHRDTARQLARESIVLLENRDALLPLSDAIESVAVIGPFADAAEETHGVWDCDARPEETVTILKGLRARLGEDRVRFAPGCWPTDELPEDVDDDEFAAMGDGPRFFAGQEQYRVDKRIAEAVAIAKDASVAVLVLGQIRRHSGECSWTNTLHLPSHQQRLLEAVAATSTPVVLLVMAGRPLSLKWAKENIPTIAQIWQLGSEAGNAVADILFGEHAPCGRLSLTVGRHIAREPSYYNYHRLGREWNRKLNPLWPFGYGLSYTSFEYADLELDRNRIAPGETVTAAITVRNSGSRAGREVVQLYLRDEVASLVRPIKTLRDFRLINLESGAEERLRFHIRPEDCVVVNANSESRLEPGAFTVQIGPHSAEGLTTEFRIV